MIKVAQQGDDVLQSDWLRASGLTLLLVILALRGPIWLSYLRFCRRYLLLLLLM